MGAQWSQIDILKGGYKYYWIGTAPRQRIAVHNPTISTLAANILNTEVQGLLQKGTFNKGSILTRVVCYFILCSTQI